MAATAGGMKTFYSALLAVAVVGVGALFYQLTRPADKGIPANVIIQPADTAGFSGYVMGSDSAPVEITEYADYQCPACQDFATVQMPSVEQTLIQTGRARWRYRDFPLAQHPHARLAAHAAACAHEQGKFWEMHRRIYDGQASWSPKGNAASSFRDYARAENLNLEQYDACMKSGKYAGRIEASVQEGSKMGVNSTPTFLIGGRLFPGKMPSDRMKQIVDSIAPPLAAAPAK